MHAPLTIRVGPPDQAGRTFVASRRHLSAFLAVIAWVLSAGTAVAQGAFAYQLWGSATPSAGWEIFAGQFAGSAASDLVLYFPAQGELWVAESTGSAYQNSAAEWATVNPPGDWRFATGEFTGDTLTDVVGYHPSNGTVWVLRNTGTGFVAELRGSITPSTGVRIYPGDFDGDGLLDVALYDEATGEIRVGTSDLSTFTFSLWFTVSPAAGWTFASEEFTGDTRSDLAGYHPSTGVIWIGAGTGTAFSFSASAFAFTPTSGWVLHAGHFDTSGPADLFAYDPASGTLWVGLGTGTSFDFSFGPWSPNPVGPTADWQFAPGDFDLDGRLDVGAYHPSNGSLWAMLQSDPPPLGYAWPLSGAAGDTIDFMVSGGSDPTVEFLRHTSVGSTVDSELMGTTSYSPAVQPCAADADRFGCGWTTSFSLVVPASWPSGMYSARIASDIGADFDITFVVKPGASTVPTVAVLANVNTWNAYNSWGGGSKYSGVERGSFLRPNFGAAPIGEGFANHHLARAELWMLGWLEAEGYQPHLFTDIDFHNGEVGTGYERLVLSAHPEYFTIEMYDWLKAHLDAGGSLLYVAGNGLYEKTTYDNGQRELIFLGGVPGGPREPELFRRLVPSRAERSLLGVATEGCGVPSQPFTVLDAAHPVFAGSGVTNGTLFGLTSLNIGGGAYLPGRASAWEVDTSAGPGAVGGGCNSASPPIPPSTLPAGLTVVARAQTAGALSGGEIVYYDHPAGGRVLSVGSLTANGSLVIDPVLQQMARNALGPPGSQVPALLPVGAAVLLGSLTTLMWVGLRRRSRGHP